MMQFLINIYLFTFFLFISKIYVQYIGETKHHLNDRFSEQRHAIKKAIAKQHIDQPAPVSDHFTLPDHSMDNIELVPLDSSPQIEMLNSQGKRSVPNLQGQDP